jgi:hypothetical protein
MKLSDEHHTLAPLIPGKKHRYTLIADWMGPKTHPENLEKGKSLVPARSFTREFFCVLNIFMYFIYLCNH